MSEIRKDYLKITLVFYLVWASVFILEGLYANSLPTSDLTSSIDKRIPLLPGFVWFYILCYILPLVPLFFVQDWHRFNLALIAFAMCTFVAFIGHLLLPIAFPRQQLGASISENLLKFIYLNACILCLDYLLNLQKTGYEKNLRVSHSVTGRIDYTIHGSGKTASFY
jgi:uncharacterized membrane protein YhaH (DUF805 family)